MSAVRKKATGKGTYFLMKRRRKKDANGDMEDEPTQVTKLYEEAERRMRDSATEAEKRVEALEEVVNGHGEPKPEA